jgi:DNA polymerase III subunit epsilon
MFFNDFEADKTEAAKWAADLLKREDWVILDTETTGLGGRAEIVQISLVNPKGEPILNTLVKPLGEIEPEARAVHGITADKCSEAPTWPEVFPKLCEAIAGKTVIIYNSEFDKRMIEQTCRAWKLDSFPLWYQSQTYLDCAMEMYSQWVGEWNSYHHTYRWQKLPGGDHSALGDVLATLEIIKEMAASYKSRVLA